MPSLSQAHLNQQLQIYCDKENGRFKHIIRLSNTDPKPDNVPEGVIFIQKSQEEIIVYWSENDTIKEHSLPKNQAKGILKKLPNQGKSTIDKKFIAKVVTKLGINVDSSFIDDNGNCNGWSFLFAYYSSIDKIDEFNAIRKYISKWDPKSNDYSLKPPLNAIYKNGHELLQQIINDLVWYQYSKVSHLYTDFQQTVTPQSRKELYDLFNNGNIQLTPIASCSNTSTNNLMDDEFISFVKMATNWPGAWIDIIITFNDDNIMAHNVSIYITPEGELLYFDSNHGINKTIHAISPNEILQQMKDFYAPDSVHVKAVNLYKFHHATSENEAILAHEKIIITPEDALDLLKKSLQHSSWQFIEILLKNIPKDNLQKARIIGLIDPKMPYENIKMLVNYGIDLNQVLIKLLEQPASKNIIEQLINAYFPANKEKIKNILDKKNILTGVNFQTDYESLNLLASYGINLNQRNTMGLTPLHVACQSGNSVLIKALITNGANVDVIDKRNKTPLHYIATAKSVDHHIILALASSRNIMAKDSQGNTPLHIAIKHKNVKFIKELLEMKLIDVNAKDEHGKTLLEYASSIENPVQNKIIALLKAHGAKALGNTTTQSITSQPTVQKVLTKPLLLRERAKTLNLNIEPDKKIPNSKETVNDAPPPRKRKH